MRTGKVKIKGEEYLTCFSTRVLIDIEDKYGDSTEGLKGIMERAKVSELFWLMARLIDAGNRYAEMEGIENPGILSEDELIDSVGVDEYATIFKGVADTIAAGDKQTIQTKPTKESKNENATSQAG